MATTAFLFGWCTKASVQPAFNLGLRPVSRQALKSSSSRSAINLHFRSFHSPNPLRSPYIKPPSSPPPPPSISQPRISKLKSSLTSLLPFRRHAVISPIGQMDNQSLQKKGGLFALAIAATALGLGAFLNRPDPGKGWTEAQKKYVNKSFMFLGGGLAIVAASTRLILMTSFPTRLLYPGPQALMALAVGGSIVSVFALVYTPPDQKFQRFAWWTFLNVCQGPILAPLYYLNPAMLSQAAAYGVGILASLTYVGATASNDQYLYASGVLLSALTIIAFGAALCPLLLPPPSRRALHASEIMALSSGLALFSTLLVFDVQKLVQDARIAEDARRKGEEPPVDEMREGLSLELDFVNILLRIVQLYAHEHRK